jgi:hypothetical protein
MNSYFSRLAKQSKIRYGRTNTDSPGATGKNSVGEITPLHREDTLLTAPAETKIETPVKEKNEDSSAETLSPKAKSQKAMTQRAEQNFTESTPDSKIAVLPIEQIFEAKNRNVRAESEIQETVSKENQSNRQFAIPDDSPATGQTIFTENKTTSDANQSDSVNQIDSSPVEFARSEIELTKIPRRSPEYFQKTAENLQTEQADKSKVQQILLREIHEWINGASALTDEDEQTSRLNADQKNEIRVVPATAFEERPSSEGEAAKLTAHTNTKILEEQNYSLSIGSINIVVEEPPPVQNTTIQKTIGEAGKTTTQRESSRLNRHYL